MFFLGRERVRMQAPLEPLEPLLPHCYDEFRGTKIHSIIQHPSSEGERVFLLVPYVGSAAVKSRGARWDADARRWWYWSGSSEHLRTAEHLDAWMQALLDLHAVSAFADWDVDADRMRRSKCPVLDQDDFFDYTNPAAARK